MRDPDPSEPRRRSASGRPGRLGPLLRAFADAQRGSIATILAVAIVPLVALTGAAVDYSRFARLQTGLLRAADAAVLGALAEAKRQIGTGATDKNAFAAATTVGEQIYASLGSIYPGRGTPKVDFTRSGARITASLKTTGTSSNVFASFVGLPVSSVSVTAGAAGDLDPYVDVALMIDVSGSMAIGADQAAISRLNTELGCAFACHDNVPVKGTSMDAYQWAIAQGIPLRTQAVNTGLVEFLDWLATRPNSSTLNRVGLVSFADTITLLSNYTSSMVTVKANLPKTTNAASEYTAATHFTEAMALLTPAVGVGGDGSSPSKAKKLVIIATDGVQDPNRTWTWNLALRPMVGPFDPAACQAMKTAGVTVGVIHTVYYPLSTDWGYNATLGQPSLIGGKGTRADDVAPQLAKCASPGLYTVATSATIGDAFQRIFATFSTDRITN